MTKPVESHFVLSQIHTLCCQQKELEHKHKVGQRYRMCKSMIRVQYVLWWGGKGRLRAKQRRTVKNQANSLFTTFGNASVNQLVSQNFLEFHNLLIRIFFGLGYDQQPILPNCCKIGSSMIPNTQLLPYCHNSTVQRHKLQKVNFHSATSPNQQRSPTVNCFILFNWHYWLQKCNIQYSETTSNDSLCGIALYQNKTVQINEAQ